MSLDKLRKIGIKNVRKELIEKRNISPKTADQILEIISTKGESNQLIEIFKKKMANIPEAQEGLAETEEILDYLKTAGIEEKYYRFDPSIARGLAHYTGPIWEVEVIEGGVGSVAGCGRYDDVIGQYLGGKEKIPATGGSFGIERMMEILKDRKMVSLPKSYAQVLVTIFDKNLAKESIKTATLLRNSEVATILYPDANTRLDKQLKYADKKSIPYAIILGPEEIGKNLATLKDLTKRTQKTDSLEKIINQLSRS